MEETKMLNVKSPIQKPVEWKTKIQKGKGKERKGVQIDFFAYKTPKHGMSTPTGVRCRNTSSSEKRERKKVS